MQDYKKLYNFLCLRDEVLKADLIMGFGHYDLRIPEKCIQLFEDGFAPQILFTGGIGAGSSDFINPEAVEFLEYVKTNSTLDLSTILLEKESTNTGENFQKSIEILTSKGLLPRIRKIILVATPTRQLRVYLTAKKYFPHVELINCPPFSEYERDMDMNKDHDINFEEHLRAELYRIKEYPKMGFSENIKIPNYLNPFSS